MILGDYYFKTNIEKIKDESFNYLTLDISKLKYPEDSNKFKLTVNALFCMNYLAFANEFLKSQGTNDIFEIEIINKIISKIIKDESLAEDELKAYFLQSRKIDSLFENMKRLSSLIDHIYIDSETELMLIGLPLSKFYEMDNKGLNRCDGLTDQYGEIKFKFLSGEFSYQVFIDKAKSLINSTQEALREIELSKAS